MFLCGKKQIFPGKFLVYISDILFSCVCSDFSLLFLVLCKSINNVRCICMVVTIATPTLQADIKSVLQYLASAKHAAIPHGWESWNIFGKEPFFVFSV